MWKPFHTFFNYNTLSDATKTCNRESDVANSIYKDGLSKKVSRPKKVKKGDHCLAKRKEEAANNWEKRSLYAHGSSIEGTGVIRVKVKMTKQEAARLMSKCKDGGVLEFKDAAHELVQIPIARLSLVSSVDSYGVVLKTIPEEDY